MEISDEEINTLEAELGNGLSFDEPRRQALKFYSDVHACPGSGKTTLVASKLILLVKKWEKKRSGICVLTHTNVARDEIVERLQRHPVGRELLTYPHFIGTIQEFVNRFLGIPFCKSRGWEVSQIDDEKCFEFFERCLRPGTKTYLTNKYAYDKLRSFKYFFESGELKYNVPAFPNVSSSDSYNDLIEKKSQLVERGLYYYSEMYAFGNNLIEENEDVKKALQHRFPVVLIDEMQDTQKFQDDLLNSIFLCETVSIQRFGDPDQAIFTGMGGSVPNSSYNSANLTPITNSHRFGESIASKIKGLSFNSIANLTSNFEVDEKPHTVFLYNDETILQVIEEFGDLVVENLSIDLRENIKALGSVGKENQNGLTIKHYWPEYDNERKPKQFKPSKYCQILKICAENVKGDVHQDYKLLYEGILDLLKKMDIKSTSKRGFDVYFGEKALKDCLESKGKLFLLRKLLVRFIIEPFPDDVTWDILKAELLSVLDISLPLTAKAREFLEYDNTIVLDGEQNAPISNMFICTNGQKVEVTTIHSAKGETHNATLVLETKYRTWADISEMKEYFVQDKVRPVENILSPTSKASIFAGYMKKLFVATSRPRYLLCLAVHADRMPEEIKILFEEKGWRFKVVSPQVETE